MALNKIESLDTNIILRYILGDVPEQYATVQKLLDKPDIEYRVADIAISESVYVMEKNMGRPRSFIAKALYNFLNQPNIVYSKPLFEEILPLYESHPKLSFNDCYLSALTRQSQSAPLWTFDHKFATQSPIAKKPR